ncbi:MAG: DUF928 domain-containing protein [Scytolyngbya sp. HA4215-MV1]|jgi:hypothetical protein|nr:DUF928 domain-containing protein [Scytolyngbya sp. HA4215-MV1]
MYLPIRSTILLVAAISIALPVFSLSAKPTPIQIAPQPVSWGDVLAKQPRDSGSGHTAGTRPADLCWIAPDRNAQLWQMRPVFVWRGGSNAIGLRKAGSTQILWQKSIVPTNPNYKRLLYTGPVLQPGQTYEWLFFFDRLAKEPQLWIPFQLMSERDRAPITADLVKLEMQLKAKKASAETVTLQRANYFAQHDLWADVLQEVYSVKTPAADLQQVAQEIETTTCQTKP